MARKYLPSIGDLVDRFVLNQIKCFKLEEHRDHYNAENEDILHDIDLLLKEQGVNIPILTLRAMICLGIVVPWVWLAEDYARKGDENSLKWTHALNSTRNQCKNKILEGLGLIEGKDLQLDTITEDFKMWSINW